MLIKFCCAVGMVVVGVIGLIICAGIAIMAMRDEVE